MTPPWPILSVMEPIWWIVIIMTALIGSGGVLFALWYGESRKRKTSDS